MGGLGKKGDSMYTYVGKKRLSGPKAEVEDILEELVDVMEEKYGMKVYSVISDQDIQKALEKGIVRR